MRVKKILSMLISCCLIFALVGSFQIITNANPSSYWCLTHKQTNCNHCSTHTMQTAGTTNTLSCTVGHGAIRVCLTSGCGKVFYQYAPAGHDYNAYDICERSTSCGAIESYPTGDFQHYMYRTSQLDANHISNYSSGHGSNNGLDIITRLNSSSSINGYQIYAQGNGIVNAVGANRDERGYYVEIQYSNGWRVRYLHLKNSPSVSVNSSVSTSTLLGLTGNTGGSITYGYHLHQDVREETDSEVYTNTDTLYPSRIFDN